MTDQSTVLLTSDEACQRLNVSRSYLPKMRVYGGGPQFVRIGRSIRYRPEDIDAWLAQNACASTSDYAASTRASRGD